MMRLACTLAVCLVAWVTPAGAYLHLSAPAATGTTELRWRQLPARWFATDRGVPGVPASAFQTAVARAFDTWQAVPTASVSFQFGGFTGASPFDDDGVSAFGFEDAPELERVLGSTSFVVDVVTGEVVEADVFFNTRFTWSVAQAGDPDAFDLQSVATHEIGHFLGLGHSALGETEVLAAGGRRVLASGAVMFPISFGRGNIADRTLQPDDVAGVSELYPDGDLERRFGGVQGRVRLGGRAVIGAHVVAFNPRTGAMVGGFSLGREGEFAIAGLEPGPHVIRVEPLDDAEVESFFTGSGIERNFRPVVHRQLLVAPRGGSTAPVDIEVVPR